MYDGAARGPGTVVADEHGVHDLAIGETQGAGELRLGAEDVVEGDRCLEGGALVVAAEEEHAKEPVLRRGDEHTGVARCVHVGGERIDVVRGERLRRRKAIHDRLLRVADGGLVVLQPGPRDRHDVPVTGLAHAELMRHPGDLQRGVEGDRQDPVARAHQLRRGERDPLGRVQVDRCGRHAPVRRLGAHPHARARRQRVGMRVDTVRSDGAVHVTADDAPLHGPVAGIELHRLALLHQHRPRRLDRERGRRGGVGVVVSAGRQQECQPHGSRESCRPERAEEHRFAPYPIATASGNKTSRGRAASSAPLGIVPTASCLPDEPVEHDLNLMSPSAPG